MLCSSSFSISYTSSPVASRKESREVNYCIIHIYTYYFSALAAASQYLSVAEHSVVTSDALKAKLKLLL